MESQFVGTFSIGQTLDRGIRLYRIALKRVILLLFAPALFGVFYMSKVIRFQPNPANPFAMFGPSYFFSVIIGVWAWIVITRYLYRISQGEQLELGTALKLATPLDFLYILTYIIFAIIMVLSIIPLGIPFLYLLNISYIAGIIIIVEKEYLFGWLPRVFKLTKGRWWKTFVINIITFLIVFVPVYGAMALWGIGMGLSMAKSIEAPMDTSTGSMMMSSPMAVAGAILYFGVIIFVTPIFMTINIVHYNSLRSEKENVDIHKELDDLNAAK